MEYWQTGHGWNKRKKFCTFHENVWSTIEWRFQFKQYYTHSVVTCQIVNKINCNRRSLFFICWFQTTYIISYWLTCIRLWHNTSRAQLNRLLSKLRCKVIFVMHRLAIFFFLRLINDWNLFLNCIEIGCFQIFVFLFFFFTIWIQVEGLSLYNKIENEYLSLTFYAMRHSISYPYHQ